MPNNKSNNSSIHENIPTIPPSYRNYRRRNYMNPIISLVKANDRYAYTYISNLKYSEKLFQAFRDAMETKSTTPMDLFIHAITFRAESINSGYLSLTEQGNYLCAISLIRMQIDNFLICWAGLACKDRARFFTTYQEGKPINKLTDKDGNQLTQGFIVRSFSEINPIVKEIYQGGNDYVHPSHIFQEESIDLTNGIQLISYRNHECSEDIKRLAKRHMLIANNLLADCLVRWVQLKHGIEPSLTEKIDLLATE